jgi:hypothetical protein
MTAVVDGMDVDSVVVIVMLTVAERETTALDAAGALAETLVSANALPVARVHSARADRTDFDFLMVQIPVVNLNCRGLGRQERCAQ